MLAGANREKTTVDSKHGRFRPDVRFRWSPMKPKLKRTENFKFYAYLIGLMTFLGAMFVLAALLTRPFNEMIVYLNNPNESRTWGEWAVFWSGALLLGPFWTCIYLFFKVCEKQILEYLLPKKETTTIRGRSHSKLAHIRRYGRAMALVRQGGQTASRSRFARRKQTSVRTST